jgi:hypothetical protein
VRLEDRDGARALMKQLGGVLRANFTGWVPSFSRARPTRASNSAFAPSAYIRCGTEHSSAACCACTCRLKPKRP